MRVLTLTLLTGLAGCGGTPEAAPPLETGITVAGHFGEDGAPSEDVSGLACDWQHGAGGMRCLAIEDEGDAAQWASFDGAILAAGRRFGLLGVGQPLGTPPRDICSDADPDNRELDGEAAAFDDGVFYVTGSHGCSRNSDELRPASFIVARIAPDDPAGEIVAGTVAIATSHRLSGMLRRDPALARFFGTSLRAGNGLTIEGLAARGDRIVFGLRAPVVDGTAYLFETSATALFSPDIVGPGRAVPIALGADAGVRDLAFLPDGRLLILSGPAQDQDVPYRLHLRGADGAAPLLATIDAPRGGKAETMAITGIDGDTVSLLILFDGVADGAPQRLAIRLP
ncbi:DUF3616 domain-containing protein [Parasphingopyxis algicola]|uniref:DUF3616 domain-containing protein n=1 Tax=Parasphingopyxis algicola TaxID=2026624 RepID=UPI0015A4ADD1|nr:DUF3616 domain-containing protein [Parasphingopyxis algicola]QLC25830.1 DUF3616 domain-containing protein [Parasphingopyxis algicola]